ncbi:DHA2 family efflux MFS transporter permease subunit [Paenibacillus filicis]|uniref:DHA2 family efflux MFS transporter permease subunit n=1 Tax=Paenibacillus gyeongsangnamensis TaxID=3388067 RepID=A0ABT4Q759_9BACL|nr:DHA2 family efflux MFS transporter permease subunit [Paenibacillus filicis]MCZ8512704.1 DHA2 family efflux MFS transporter permease subunit [Paenibacillus filicis]
MSDSNAVPKPAEGGGSSLALIAIVMGTFVAVLNSSLMNVALPQFVTVFGSTVATIQWVITGYMLASAVVIPLSGFLGDTLGAKNLFVLSVAGFTVGSILCGLAWSDSSLILFRIVTGLAGGFIMPIGMSIIYSTFPREKVGTALGMWGVATMVAPALGPTLGGYIIQYYSWRLLFFMSIPFGIAAVILGKVLLKPTPQKKGLKLDVWGMIFSMLFFGCLLLALSKGQSEGWTSLYIVSLFYVSFFSLLLFIWVELGVSNPLLNLRVFKDSNFTMSVIASSLVMMGMYGGTFLTPIYLQNIQGLTPMQTGLLLMPQSLAMAFMMPITGKLVEKVGVKVLGVIGLTILGTTTVELHLLTQDTPNHWLDTLLIIRGIGIGMCMMPLTQIGMINIPTPDVSRASSLSNVVRQVAASMGITILTAIMSSRQTMHYNQINESVTVDSLPANQTISMLSSAIMQGGVDAATAGGSAAAYLAGIMQKEALVRGIADTFYVSAIPVLLCIPLVLLFKTKRKVAQAAAPAPSPSDRAASQVPAPAQEPSKA